MTTVSAAPATPGLIEFTYRRDFDLTSKRRRPKAAFRFKFQNCKEPECKYSECQSSLQASRKSPRAGHRRRLKLAARLRNAPERPHAARRNRRYQRRRRPEFDPAPVPSQKTHMIGLWPPAPDHETVSGAAARSGWRFPAGSSMMRGGSGQSGRLIFGDAVPAQKTVPDAAASNPRLHPAARPWTHAKSTRARLPAAWRPSAASSASAFNPFGTRSKRHDN